MLSVGLRVIASVHESDSGLDGFVFASLLPAPPVYRPGGPVALVDDIALRNSGDWPTLGAALVDEAVAEARRKGAVLAIVVTDHDDEPKRILLVREGYSLASEWHLGDISDTGGITSDGGIRRADVADLPILLDLSEQRRNQYQSYQPVFWRNAPDAREKQGPFLARTLRSESSVALVHESAGQVDGFLIGNLVPSPPAFRPALVTCHIDDFCVADPKDWSSVGNALLHSARRMAKARDAARVAVICGHLDHPKRTMLASAGLAISSEWWVKVF